jgi:hypothetical protein
LDRKEHILAIVRGDVGRIAVQVLGEYRQLLEVASAWRRMTASPVGSSVPM